MGHERSNRRKSRVHRTGFFARKWVSRIVTWVGLSAIGILTIPTGVLIGLMYIILSVTDYIVRRLNDPKRAIKIQGKRVCSSRRDVIL